MSPAFAIDPVSLVAIVAMAVVTYALRLGGMVLAFRLSLSPRAAAAFEAVPAAVLVAVIAPDVLFSGKAEAIAALVTAVAAIRLPLVGTVLVGIAAIIVLRAWLG